MHKIEGSSVILSVENKCKFCDWKLKEGQTPLFMCTKGGDTFAFCPMCRFELDISSKEYEKEKTTKEKTTKEKLMEWKEGPCYWYPGDHTGIGIVDKNL